jgi:hypothetical protein
MYQTPHPFTGALALTIVMVLLFALIYGVNRWLALQRNPFVLNTPMWALVALILGGFALVGWVEAFALLDRL